MFHSIHIRRLLGTLLTLIFLAAPALSEIILWEDEEGKVLLGDDGEVAFIPAGQAGEATAAPDEALFSLSEDDVAALVFITPVPTDAPAQTPSPEEVTAIAEKYGLHTPVPATPAPLDPPERTLQYGDSGDHVLAAQHKLTDLGYYHGKCSGDFLEGTQSAARRFQKYNNMPQTGKIDAATWIVLFSSAAIARDGSTPYATPSPVPVATPVPTPTPFVYERKVEYGDSNAVVAAVQTRLAELGFYDAKVSGGFYKVTRNAVRAFQQHNGLTVDGVAGRDTQEALFSASAVPAWAAPLPSPTPKPAKYTLMVDVANQITRAYTYDESGEYTVLVREMICSTGTTKNPTPLGTTIMPSKRARWGYFPTWDSHAQYLTRIDSANAFHSVLYSAADETTLSVKSYEDLGSRASHGCVRLYVQDAKWIYDNCGAGTIITVYEGEYDPEYTMTLRRPLNTYTLREGDLPAPTPTPVYSRENWPTEYRTLFRGKQGKDVYMLQVRLAELGYYTGSITGGYYGGTIKAVEAFQRDHGLTVDGAAGKQTQSLLFSSAVDPATPEPEASPSAQPEAAATAAPTASPEPTATPMPTALPTPHAPIAESVG
ncbi:MAG: peptidoglycan-binding protein [Clostridia bacterium]|nr:peptidoglycan-binding protein [Clostridia bacterium]